jgi:hypothetical protein
VPETPFRGSEKMSVLCYTCERFVRAAISGSLAKYMWHEHHCTIGSLVEAIGARCAICLMFRGKGLDIASNLARNNPGSPTLLHFCENQEYSEYLPSSSLQFEVSLRIKGAQDTLGRSFLFILKKGTPGDSILCSLQRFLILDS